MSKIVLDDVISGYGLSKINENFQKIQDELNNKVLYRDNPDGETNTLEQDVDVNGFSLYNVEKLNGMFVDSLSESAQIIADNADLINDFAPYLDEIQDLAEDFNAELALRTPEVDNYTALDAYIGDATSVYVKGVSNIFDGGHGVFRRTTDTPSSANGIYRQDGLGRWWKREFSGDINVKWFGAVGNGVADDTAAIQSAIDYAATVIYNGPGDVDSVAASVELPPGIYRTTTAIILRNCVQIRGAGSGATSILVDHAGNGMQSTAGSGYYANIHITGIYLRSNGAAQNGIVQVNMIRNCYCFDVICEGFYNNFYFENTWTNKLDQCCGLSAKNSQIYGVNVGGIHVYGGRYDVAESHGVYIDSTAAELIMTDVAVQFGKKSAVYVKNCYTVELNQCFFEGNCIGSASDYYVYINCDTPYTLTSASIIDCVMNNRGESARNGLGILYIANIENFTYRERWVRNGVSGIPIVGTGVEHAHISFNNAGSRSSVLTNVAIGSQANAVVSQVARPYGIFGQDMADVSFSPTQRAALNVGTDAVGVAIGTNDGHPAIQGYGDSYKLHLNPQAGYTYFGQSNLAYMESGTNEYFGRFREATQAAASNITPVATTGFVSVSCSGGNRNVDLTNISADYGRRVTIAKSDSGSNAIIVTPKSGETINGAGNWSSTAAYATVSLIGNSGNWIIV